MLYTLNKTARSLPSFKEALANAVAGKILKHDEIVRLLQAETPSEIQDLHTAAGNVVTRVFGKDVSIRGIVEFSNACEKNCDYCGVPSYDEKFLIPHESILECAQYMYERGYRNLVLQSGEITSESRIDWLISLLDKIKEKYGTEPERGMCVILSVGELSRDQYLRLARSGAQRYILRIEAANRQLYESMHPADHLYETRVNCLLTLKELGYVTGTGSMIGLPNQTFDHLAEDIEFFRDNQFHMVGSGPYVIHNNTKMGKEIVSRTTKDERTEADRLKVQVTLNYYDVLRLCRNYINIAATTALDTLAPGAKATALLGGSNVVMPIITPKMFRGGYQLYEGKKEVDMDRDQTHQKVLDLMKKIGKTPRFDRWNHPPAYMKQKMELALKKQ